MHTYATFAASELLGPCVPRLRDTALSILTLCLPTIAAAQTSTLPSFTLQRAAGVCRVEAAGHLGSSAIAIDRSSTGCALVDNLPTWIADTLENQSPGGISEFDYEFSFSTAQIVPIPGLPVVVHNRSLAGDALLDLVPGASGKVSGTASLNQTLAFEAPAVSPLRITIEEQHTNVLSPPAQDARGVYHGGALLAPLSTGDCTTHPFTCLTRFKVVLQSQDSLDTEISSNFDYASNGLDFFNKPNVSTNLVFATAPLVIANLGESFASGAGLAPLTNRTNDAGRRCEESESNYARRISDPVMRTVAALLEDVSCSGSTLADLMQSQVPKLLVGNSLVIDPTVGPIRPDIDLVLVSAGGNDTGWTRAVAACLRHTCSAVSIGTQEAADLRADLESLLRELKVRAPNATIIVNSYPRLFAGVDCPDACVAPHTRTSCLTGGEQSLLNALTLQVNQIISDSATAAGAHFVDIDSAFRGHEVCSASPWIFPVVAWVTIDFQAGFNISSLHPNDAGHAAYGRTIQQKLESMIRFAPSHLFPSGLPKNP